ncbi:MAG: prepilin-type N-terminal cleavage/methylation domain-containing protein [Granulosicoccus sp.]|nr:prepilin-type N-terminal cleavage/methylation domain-containing protein [Granulosicoccus sp.]
MSKLYKVKGFTLIELVIAIVIIGILAAIAVPKFVDLSGDATVAAKKGMSGAVKSSHAIAVADLKRFPTNTELATYVNGDGISAVATGIEVTIDGTTHTVATYTDSNCSTAITATTDFVQCVGSIP